MTATLFQWCFDHISYWTIVIFMAIESSFLPFPSEVVVPPAAYKAAAGEMNVVLVVICATLGANLGALFNYAVAFWLGRPFVYKFANSRLGRLCLVDEKKIHRAEAFFRKYGAIATLFGRLVPVVRQFISIPAGLARMGLGKFLLYTTLGAGLWNTILATVGYSLHAVVPKNQLFEKINEYSHAISYSIAGIVLFALLFWLAKNYRDKRATPTERDDEISFRKEN